MDRRTFLGAAAANLVAVPFAAMAQQTEKVRRIGFLSLGEPSSSTPAELPWDPAPLRDLGWIEGKNLVIERRWAGDRGERLQRFAAELVRLKLDIIMTSGTDAAVAAEEATTRIPIVIFAGDPVGAGLVASLSRPGANITGFSIVQSELRVKRLEVLRELLPAAQRVGELVNPTNPFSRVARKEYEEAYRSLGMQPLFIDVAVASELGNAFTELARRRAQALVVPLDNLFDANSVWIMRAAVGNALPTMVGSYAGGWRVGVLYLQLGGAKPPLRVFHRQDIEGREARRSAHRATDEVRARDQPQDRESTRPDRSAIAAAAR
jgi:putative ABC transport system substrate-binding protein